MTAIKSKGAVLVGLAYLPVEVVEETCIALRKIVARGNDRTFTDQYVATNESEGD